LTLRLPNKDNGAIRLQGFLCVLCAFARELSAQRRKDRKGDQETLMLESFCKEKLAPLALRLALGSFCVYHGYLKIMAAGGTAWYPALPKGWQLLISWGEFCAGVAILLGFRCRWAAGIVLALTAGTLIWWQGWNVFRLPLPSMEPTVMFLLFTLTLIFLGAGEVSLDGRGGKTVAGRSLKKN
jgi:uncharacterized membrane protein YphA (DoxX/SURF4 family)